MSSETVSKTYHIPPKYAEALEALRKAGYSDDGSLTKVSAFKQAIKDAWAKHFPNKPFPGDEQS